MCGDGQAGMLQIARTSIAAHGPLVLWRGWLPQFMRILPYATLQFAFMERIAKLFGVSMT